MDAIERLAQLIEDHAGDVSSRDLAERAGRSISHQTIQNIRNRKPGSVQRRTLEGLHRALRIPLSDVYAAAGMAQEPVRLPAGSEDLNEARRAALVAFALDLVEEQQRETGS